MSGIIMFLRIILFITISTSISLHPLHAQAVAGNTGSSLEAGNGAGESDGYDVGRKAEYFFGSHGSSELMIKVNLWGKVLRPGLYEIPIKTDLVTLMSFAGGPTEEARLDNIRIIRHVQGTAEVRKIDVKKYLANGDSELIPVLMPGDTILISGSTLHLFALTVRVLSQIMTAINFYFFVTTVL